MLPTHPVEELEDVLDKIHGIEAHLRIQTPPTDSYLHARLARLRQRRGEIWAYADARQIVLPEHLQSQPPALSDIQ